VENEEFVTNQVSQDKIIKNSDKEQTEEFMHSDSIEQEVESITEKKSAQEEAVIAKEINSLDPVVIEDSTDLMDAQSTTSIEAEENSTTENDKRDDAVTIPSNMDVEGKYTKLSEDTTEAGDETAIGRVSEQKMLLPEVAAKGGGGKPKGEFLTLFIALITSLVIIDSVEK